VWTGWWVTAGWPGEGLPVAAEKTRPGPVAPAMKDHPMNDTVIQPAAAATAAQATDAATEQERLESAEAILCKELNRRRISRVDGTLRIDGDKLTLTELCAFDDVSTPTVFDHSGPIAVGAGDHRRSYPSLQAFIADFVTNHLRLNPREYLSNGTLSLHASGYISPPIDWATRFADESKQRAAEMEKRKRPLIEALRRLGFASVVAVYDGEGDSGQIDSIAAYATDSSELTIRGDIVVGDAPPEALHEVLDEFFWDCLTTYHDGFENNDGGYGEITIEMATGKVTIDHNDRIIEVDNTVSEI
jgi:uncharacterized protein DUF6878